MWYLNFNLKDETVWTRKGLTGGAYQRDRNVLSKIQNMTFSGHPVPMLYMKSGSREITVEG